LRQRNVRHEASAACEVAGILLAPHTSADALRGHAPSGSAYGWRPRKEGVRGRLPWKHATLHGVPPQFDQQRCNLELITPSARAKAAVTANE
jgi:hypothetical protein